MIKIRFDEPDSLDWNEWREDCKNKTLELIKSVKNGNPVKISDLYKDARAKIVYKSIEGPFKGRCAYCETNVIDYQPGDMDHFRPKSGVRDGDNRKVQIEHDSGKIDHPGYYWLAYDWENLLLACKRCNSYYSYQDAKIGKGERFPVKGAHATGPGEEKYEETLLINPLEDDPKEHIEYDKTNGQIRPFDEKGRMCNKIFGLNMREQLISDRIEAYDKTKEDLIRHFNNNDRKNLAQEIADIIEGKKPFTLARRAALKEYVSDYL